MTVAHVITPAAIRRLIKAAGGRRIRQSLDLFEEVPGTTDDNGIVHEILTTYLDGVIEKAVSLMEAQRSKTMLPRHIREVTTILGDEASNLTNLPYCAVGQNSIESRVK